MVDTRDPDHVDVNEINCVFADETGSLHEKAKAKVDEFIHNQGAENQVAPILKGIPEDLIRPDRQQLMDVMLEKRLGRCKAGQPALSFKRVQVQLFLPAKSKSQKHMEPWQN
eukprot:243273-Pelagomonas_calceolata.AAC.7